MGLFSKNEPAAPGEKHFLNVIKNTGSGEFLLWKNPEEDFNIGSTLIVAENEQALFIKDGLVEYVFDGGRHVLETENYPFLSRLRNMLSGGVSSFHCEVYFLRMADTHEIYWGTQTPIQLRDPVLGIPVTVQARGAYRVRISDSKKFFLKMVGNNEFMFTQEELMRYCESQFTGKIKSTIGKELRHSNEEVLGVCEKQEEFAEAISPAIDDVFDEYGLQLVNFSIESLDVPMDDPYRQKVEMANAERIAMLQTGQAANLLEADRIDQITGAKGRAFETLGSNWGRQQSADILSAVANNPNSGGMAATGAGFGMGMAAGGAIGSMAQGLFTDPTQSNGTMFDGAQGQSHSRSSGRFVRKNVGNVSDQGSQNSEVVNNVVAKCNSCGAPFAAGSKFCPECGAKQEVQQFCPECGALVSATAKFCPECGAKRS